MKQTAVNKVIHDMKYIENRFFYFTPKRKHDKLLYCGARPRSLVQPMDMEIFGNNISKSLLV